VLAAGATSSLADEEPHTFFRLAENNRLAIRTLSRDARVRHAGPTGDTGEYDPTEVMEMAYQQACQAATQN
jgi:hypothetical protein